MQQRSSLQETTQQLKQLTKWESLSGKDPFGRSLFGYSKKVDNNRKVEDDPKWFSPNSVRSQMTFFIPKHVQTLTIKFEIGIRHHLWGFGIRTTASNGDQYLQSSIKLYEVRCVPSTDETKHKIGINGTAWEWECKPSKRNVSLRMSICIHLSNSAGNGRKPSNETLSRDSSNSDWICFLRSHFYGRLSPSHPFLCALPSHQRKYLWIDDEISFGLLHALKLLPEPSDAQVLATFFNSTRSIFSGANSALKVFKCRNKI